MRHQPARLLAIALLLSVSLVFVPADAAARRAGIARVAEQCFPQTGKCISGPFLDYWLANGGLAQQGLPLTDEFIEVSPLDNRSYRVQYFERARFEHHPENAPPFHVLLGLVGLEQYRARYGGVPTPIADPFGPNQECATFAETGQAVCGPFLGYWRGNGGLAQQGLPLTGIFSEVNLTDGKAYLTQYFERARFEWHPENQPPFQVLLGLLGREQFLARYPNGQPAAAPPSPVPTGRIVATGRFEPKAYPGSGSLEIVAGPTGALTLRFGDDFVVENVPTLLVYLTIEPSPDSRADVERGFPNLGELQSGLGVQEYAIPAGTNLDAYRGVVVYCIQFNIPFIAAPLVRP